MTQITPLYERHLAVAGKMVDFAGWSLPINYGSQIKEHHLVRCEAGMFDVSHMCVSDVAGCEAAEYLQRLLANDVGKLKHIGQALYSCLLDESAGVIDDLIVYRTGQQQFRIVSNAATRAKDMAWLQQQISGFDCQLTALADYAMIALQGPAAREKLASVLPADLLQKAVSLDAFTACWNNELFVACTGYTGEDGFEIILPAGQAIAAWDSLLDSGVHPIGLGARDSLRLEAGMSLYGNDLDEQHTPLESALGWTIAWQPETRDFIGREALRKQQEAGVPQLLTGLILEDRGVIRAGQKVYIGEYESGMITSGGFSPSLGVGIGLVRMAKTDKDYVEVEMRAKRLRARVVRPPFVRQGRSCVTDHDFVSL